MFPGQLVSRIEAFVDNIDTESAGNRSRRRRIMNDTQEKYEEIWNHRIWRWSMGSASIVVSGGTRVGLLPLDFAMIPKIGGVWVTNTPLHQFMDTTMRQIEQGVIAASNIGYMLSGYSVADQRGTISFDTQGPLTAAIYYKRRAPLLSDKPYGASPASGGAGNVNGSVRYIVTWLTADGLESEPGAPITFVAANNVVNVTLPDPGPDGEHNIVGFNVYRTTAGATTPYYKINATPLYFGIHTTFIDNNSDGSMVVNGLGQLITYNHLAQIPEQYHQPVLLPAVRSMRKTSQGDTRDFEKMYERGLAEMVREERPFQSEVQQMPAWSPYRQC